MIFNSFRNKQADRKKQSLEVSLKQEQDISFPIEALGQYSNFAFKSEKRAKS